MSTLHSTRIQAGNKTFGLIVGDEFRKSVFGSKHFLRKPPAIAIDQGALDRAEEAGAVRVRVVDKETGWVYSATIAHIRRAGLEINRGWGFQRALPLESWVRQRQGAAIQLDLFGVKS